MTEEIVKILVERWNLPENMVRAFLTEDLQMNPNENNIEKLRDNVADLLQSIILKGD